jgi:hypothetical protein
MGIEHSREICTLKRSLNNTGRDIHPSTCTNYNLETLKIWKSKAK